MMESKYIILLSIIAMDIFVYSLSIPYFPSILLEFEGNDNGTIYFGISQSVGNGLAMFSGIITGYLSDKYSRKGAVFVSQIFAGICCLLISIGMYYNKTFYMSIYFLLAGYTLRKMNRTNAAMTAYAVDVTPKEQRDKQISRANGVMGVGFACGPAVVGFLSTLMPRELIFLFGSFVSFFNAFLAFNFLISSSSKTNYASSSSAVTWESIKAVIFHKKMINIFTIYFFGCLGQFCYIATIGVVAPIRFGIKGTNYGYMVSFFGISYAFGQLIFVPWVCKNYGSEKSRFMASLLITGLGRFYLGITKSVYMLFTLHFFVALGTALFMHSTIIKVNKFGNEYNLVGTVNGAMDSVRRCSGVLAPMIAVPIHYMYYETDGSGVSPGAILASCFYFAGFAIAFFILSDNNGSDNEGKWKKDDVNIVKQKYDSVKKKRQ